MKRKQQHTQFSRFAADSDSQHPAFSMPQNATSGQLGPKLRQESQQPRPSQRLRREEKQFEKSKLKAEKSGAKLDVAQEKLAAQKP